MLAQVSFPDLRNMEAKERVKERVGRASKQFSPSIGDVFSFTFNGPAPTEEESQGTPLVFLYSCSSL